MPSPTFKYRRLTLEELKEVEPQFIRFLAANGVPGEEWKRILGEELERADQLILEFSQVVFGSTLERIEYLQERKPNDLRTYACGPDLIRMNGLRIEGQTSLDLTDQNMPPSEMLQRLKTDGARVKLYSGERPYRPHPNQTEPPENQPDRSFDLYRLMEAGARISNGELFNTLEELKK
ncbi:MAG: DUF6495 family protein [Bacteroidota bacterium]